MQAFLGSLKKLLPCVIVALALSPHAAFAQTAMVNGQIHTGTITAPAEFHTFTFSANKNDYIALSIGEVLPGGPDPGFAPWIRLRNPNGVEIASDSGTLVAQISVAAPLTGTYTVLVASGDYYHTGTGSYRLTLSLNPGAFVVPSGDEGGAMVNGKDHQGTIYVGDLDEWSFEASQNDLIALSIGEILPSGPDPGFLPWIRLVSPTGGVIAADSGNLVAQIAVTAPLSGTYTVIVASGDYYRQAAGSYRLMLAKIPGTVTVPAGDQGGPMTNGVNHEGTLYPGDMDTWTFDVAQHDYISLSIGELPFGEVDPGFTPWIRLIGPTGVVVGSDSGSLVGQISVNAPLSGTYTVIVSSGDYYREVGGKYRLTLAKMPATLTVPIDDEGGPMTNGANHTGHIHIGDLDQWTFQATQNDFISLSIGEPPFGEVDPGFNPWIRLVGPTGVLVASDSGALVGQINVAAPLSGTYTVLVSSGDYYRQGAGDYKLTLAKIAGTFVVPTGDQGGPLLNGRIHPGQIHVGDLDQWTFQANQHDAISLSIGEPYPGEIDPGFVPWIRLFGPNGAFVAGDSGPWVAQVNVADAPLTGTYTVIVSSGDYYRDVAGNYLLTLAKTPGDFTLSDGDQGGPMTNLANHSGSIYVGDLDQWTFYGRKGAAVTLTITEPPPGEIDPGFYPWIRLYGPTGVLVGNAYGASSAIINITPTLSGRYTVLVGSGDSGADAAGNYVLKVSGATEPGYTVTPSAAANGTISPNTQQYVPVGATATFTLVPNANYTFGPVTGTCGGTLVGAIYTTAAVNADCTVIPSFVQTITYTVTASVGAGGGGTISPLGAQTSVAAGATRTFTVTPSAGYALGTVTGTCGGAFSTVNTNAFTTSPIFSNCTVVANFTAVAKPTFTAANTAVQFTAVTSGGAFVYQTATQIDPLIQTGGGTVTWTATSNQSWLKVTPASGTGPANLSISIVPSAGLPAEGVVTASIALAVNGTSNTPAPIAVRLSLLRNGTTQNPFGSVDTPTDNRTGVTGSVPFTGWILDDVDVTQVMICRSAFGAEVAPIDANCAGAAQIFVGFGLFIEGARPDVAAAFPTYPVNTKAGWGFMVLTNMLPNQGNGTYTFHIYGRDREGHNLLLGTRTMTCSNASATLPFGAIDTPTQGGVASANNYVNFGWALTQNPKSVPVDGSTIDVLVDGAAVGKADYNHFRSDIASLFPGLANSNGAVGFRILDTTLLSNGLHTVSWTVRDSGNAVEGIGSRFFVVANGTGSGNGKSTEAEVEVSASSEATDSTASSASKESEADRIAAAPADEDPVIGRRGWDLEGAWKQSGIGASGRAVIRGEEVDRFELALGEHDGVSYTGYLRVGNDLKPLPVGSDLRPNGTFTWAPGVGFVGAYDLVFVRSAEGHMVGRREVRIILAPKGSGHVGTQIAIDTPRAGATGPVDVEQPFLVAGWAADLDAAVGTGIDTLHVWAFPAEGGAPVFLGVPTMGGVRPDVAAAYGERFRESGFGLSVQGLAAGTYDLQIFPWSNVTGDFAVPGIVRVTVR